MSKNGPFDWHETARLVVTSRKLDLLEEVELTPAGQVAYQFSARGHELGQVILSQLLDRPGDAASVYYRSRPFMLGSGLTVEEALASGMARKDSLSGGRDIGVVFNMPSRGRAAVLPMAGDVGSQYTPAAGWAQALQYRVKVLGEEAFSDSAAVVLGGDGSVATNGFWSSLTMAATLALPLLFVIEDNGYAISVKKEFQTPGGDISKNLASFDGLKLWSGSGTAPEETAGLLKKAVSYVRSGQGPGLLRLRVPRLSGHSFQDNQAYKNDRRLAEEQERDPLPALKSFMVPGKMSAEDWQNMELEIEREINEAKEAAWAQEPPPAGEADRYAFFELGSPQQVGGQVASDMELPAVTNEPAAGDPRRINMIEAIRKTLDHELDINPTCLLFGEDVGKKGGVHTATLGLMEKYGDSRVFDTSLSEEGIIGRAQGMALAGLRPVPEIQFRKYADPAKEQLHNIGTLRWRTANRFAAPMVVRMPGGFGRKVGDPWHSVSDEAAFAHSVGWLLAYPSNAEDAVGLLRTALRGNDPVIFFEQRALLDAAWARRPYPGDDYAVPFGSAKIVLEGDALTVVTWGAMVERCQLAIDRIGEGVELIDLRTIVPWDRNRVLASVAKTGKCLIVHEDITSAGFGAEIAATLAKDAFLDLDGPIERLGALAVPVPYNSGLMDEVIPTVERIEAGISDLLSY